MQQLSVAPRSILFGHLVGKLQQKLWRAGWHWPPATYRPTDHSRLTGPMAALMCRSQSQPSVLMQRLVEAKRNSHARGAEMGSTQAHHPLAHRPNPPNHRLCCSMPDPRCSCLVPYVSMHTHGRVRKASMGVPSGIVPGVKVWRDFRL